MAGAAAAVGDDRGGELHYRFPVGIGHVGDQHVALLDARHLRRLGNDAYRAAADLGADGSAGHHDARAALERVALLDIALPRLHGLRARLQYVDAAVGPILAPLDVHRPAVMALDRHSVARELEHFGVAEREAMALRFGHVHRASRLARGLTAGEDHLLQLGTKRAPHDGRPAALKHWLVHIE